MRSVRRRPFITKLDANGAATPALAASWKQESTAR